MVKLDERKCAVNVENKGLSELRGGVERSSNIEFYRIIVMVLIVAHHYAVNSGLTAADGPIYADPLSWRSIFLLLLGAWGKTGINCFVMITGYFMCKSCVTLKKYVKLLGEVMFYRLMIYTIFLATGYSKFSVVDFVKAVLPVSQISSGFVGCYLVFYLTIPFLNILIQHLNEKQHIRLLLLCGFIYVALGTVHRVTMNYVSWFIVIYFIASYIRLYPKKVYENTSLWGWMTASFFLLGCVLVIVCAWFGTRTGRNIAYFFVSDSNTFLAVGLGVSSFLFFRNLRIPYNKVINRIAASTFGVLLIHANSDTMRQWLWRDTLRNVETYSAQMMPLIVIGEVLAIYVVCTVIDMIRIRLIEKPILARVRFDALVKRLLSLEARFFAGRKNA